MTIGEKIGEVLDWSGVTQKELSERTGISPSMVSSYISGTHAVSFESASKIADALDVSLWVLLNGEPLPANENEITKDESRVIGEYRLLTGDEKEMINGVFHWLNKRKRN